MLQGPIFAIFFFFSPIFNNLFAFFLLESAKKWKKVIINNNYKLVTGGITTGITDERLNQMYVEEIKHFMNCVKKRKKTINDLTQGEKTLRIALAMKESSKKGKIIIIK